MSIGSGVTNDPMVPKSIVMLGKDVPPASLSANSWAASTASRATVAKGLLVSSGGMSPGRTIGMLLTA